MNITTVFFFILLAIAAWCAWCISVADWRRRIIPDVYLFPLLLTGLMIVTFFPWKFDLTESVIAATSGYILATIIGKFFEIPTRKHSTASNTPIGMGDIKLISVGGIWLGVTGLAVTLVISCISGVIWGSIHKQKFIPFAPFFIGAGILTLLTMSFLI